MKETESSNDNDEDDDEDEGDASKYDLGEDDEEEDLAKYKLDDDEEEQASDEDSDKYRLTSHSPDNHEKKSVGCVTWRVTALPPCSTYCRQ